MSYSTYEMRRQGFCIRLGDTTTRRCIQDFSSKRQLLKNSRVFRIRYFVGRFTAARRLFVKAKYRIIFTVFPRRELSTMRSWFLLLCSCISWASLKLCLFIDILPIYYSVLYEVSTKFSIIIEYELHIEYEF